MLELMGIPSGGLNSEHNSPNMWTGLSVDERIDSRNLDFRMSGYLELSNEENISKVCQVVGCLQDAFLEETSVKGQEAALRCILHWSEIVPSISDKSGCYFIRSVISKFSSCSNLRLSKLLHNFVDTLISRFGIESMLCFIQQLVRENVTDILGGPPPVSPSTQSNTRRDRLARGIVCKQVRGVFEILLNFSNRLTTCSISNDSAMSRQLGCLLEHAVSLINATFCDRSLKEVCYRFVLLCCSSGLQVDGLGLAEVHAKELKCRLFQLRPVEEKENSVGNTIGEASYPRIEKPADVVWPDSSLSRASVSVDSILYGNWTERRNALVDLFELLEKELRENGPCARQCTLEYTQPLIDIMKSDKNVPILVECGRLLHLLVDRLGSDFSHSKQLMASLFERMRLTSAPSVQRSVRELAVAVFAKTELKFDLKFVKSIEMASVPKKEFMRFLAHAEVLQAVCENGGTGGSVLLTLSVTVVIPLLCDKDTETRELSLVVLQQIAKRLRQVDSMLNDPEMSAFKSFEDSLRELSSSIPWARRKVVYDALQLDLEELADSHPLLRRRPHTSAYQCPSRLIATPVSRRPQSTKDVGSLAELTVSLSSNGTLLNKMRYPLVASLPVCKLESVFRNALDMSVSGVLLNFMFPNDKSLHAQVVAAMKVWNTWVIAVSEEDDCNGVLCDTLALLLCRWIVASVTAELTMANTEVWLAGLDLLQTICDQIKESAIESSVFAIVAPILLENVGIKHLVVAKRIERLVKDRMVFSANRSVLVSPLCKVVIECKNKSSCLKCFEIFADIWPKMGDDTQTCSQKDAKLVAHAVVCGLCNRTTFDAALRFVDLVAGTGGVGKLIEESLRANQTLKDTQKQMVFDKLSKVTAVVVPPKVRCEVQELIGRVQQLELDDTTVSKVKSLCEKGIQIVDLMSMDGPNGSPSFNSRILESVAGLLSKLVSALSMKPNKRINKTVLAKMAEYMQRVAGEKCLFVDVSPESFSSLLRSLLATASHVHVKDSFREFWEQTNEVLIKLVDDTELAVLYRCLLGISLAEPAELAEWTVYILKRVNLRLGNAEVPLMETILYSLTEFVESCSLMCDESMCPSLSLNPTQFQIVSDVVSAIGSEKIASLIASRDLGESRSRLSITWDRILLSVSSELH